MDLAALVAPAHTVVLTQECQRGVIGDLSTLPALAQSARDNGVIDNIGRIVESGRRAGCDVIHAIAAHRPDLKGASRNARLFRATARNGSFLTLGTPKVEVVEGIPVAESDLFSYRLHGLSPIAGTDVDALLRNLGATTVVIAGVSSNVAIPNATFDAVNLGYEAVVARDAIAGFPASYTDVMIEHTLSLVATITTTDDLVAAWAGGA
jgi:nicotinamidase-related amidase